MNGSIPDKTVHTSAHLHQAAFEHALDAILLADDEGRYIDANPAACTLLGYTREELRNKSVWELTPGVSAMGGRQLWQRFLAEGRQSGRYQLQRRDGRTLTLDYRAVAGVAPGAHMSVLREVTEDPRAELAAIVTSTADAIVGKDLNGVIRSWNASAERMFGYTAEEAIGRPITMIIPPEHAGEEQDILQRIRQGQRVARYHTVRVAKDGRRLEVSLTVSPILSATGEVVGASKIARDITRQMHTERAARESRRLLQAVIDASPVAVSVMDSDGVVEIWSAGAERLFGWNREEVIGRLPPAVPPQQHREFLDHLQRTIAGDPLRGTQALRTCKGGEQIEVALWSSVLTDETGHPRGVISIAADVRERNRTERRLREKEQRLEAALAASQTGTFVWDVRSHSLHWDANLERLFALPRDTAVHTLDDFISRVHPDDRTAVLDALQRSVRDGADFEMDLRVPLPDGSIRWLHDKGRLFLDPEGRPAYMAGACVDITERKRAEEALRDSEERFRGLADNIAQFAWIADATGWIFWYNRRWFDYTGATLEEMRGGGWQKVHHPDHLDRVVDRFHACIESGEAWEDVFPLRGKDGNYRWFLSRAQPMRDATGEVLRWFGTNTDITERMEMEEALKEADRRKDAFLATLAHELRNPLAPIRSGLEVLRVSGDDPALTAEVQDAMERQVGQLVRLVDDLLDVSRISRGKAELRTARVSLGEIVQTAVEAARPLIDRLEQQLEVVLPDTAVWLQADATRLAQVFANLLTNAAKFSERGSEIRLHAERQGAGVVVRVCDRGAGIAAEHLQRIFEMFAQEPHSLERGESGLGIGLTLARMLVEMHGGHIDAHSAGPGQGSEFRVWLPASAARATGREQPGAPAAARAPGPPRRVMVVDDNHDVANMLGALLRALGEEVAIAYDGAEALEQAPTFRPELVLLDLGMPHVNGYEAARRMRAEPWGAATMLVALTGWGQEQDRKRTAAAGFDRHLTKPTDAAALRELLASLPPPCP